MASKVVTKELPNPPPTRGVRKAIMRKTTEHQLQYQIS
jgi:hypothetical protein